MPEKIKKPLLRHWLAAVFLSMLVIGGYTNAVLYKIPKIPLLTEIRLRVQDRYFKARLSYSEHFRKDLAKKSAVVLIAGDNESILNTGKNIVYDKELLAKTIENISKCGPKVIILDIMFSKGSENKNYLPIIEAIKKAGNVVIAYDSTTLGLENIDKDILGASLAYGGACFAIRGDDNIIREFLNDTFRYGNICNMPVTMSAILVYKDIPLDRVKRLNSYGWTNKKVIFGVDNTPLISIPLNDGWKALINYLYDDKNLPTIPMWKIIEEDFDPELLKGKIAILSMTADLYNDIHYTPIGRLSGGVIMANITNSIVHSDYLIEFPIEITWAIQILLGAILAVLFYRTGFLRSFVILIAAVFGSLAVSFGLFWHNIVWPAFDIIVVAFLLHVVISYYKLTILEAERKNR